MQRFEIFIQMVYFINPFNDFFSSLGNLHSVSSNIETKILWPIKFEKIEQLFVLISFQMWKAQNLKI